MWTTVVFIHSWSFFLTKQIEYTDNVSTEYISLGILSQVISPNRYSKAQVWISSRGDEELAQLKQ